VIVRSFDVAAFLLAALLAAATTLSGCHGVFLRPGLVGETRVESARFVLRTDVTQVARAALLEAAEAMLTELEVLLPPEEGGEGERREIIAFARADDFHRYLRAHLFAQERAIGFYCDMGRECALVWRDPPGPEDVRVLRHELVHQHLSERLRGRIPAWLEEGLSERIALGLEVDGPFGGTLIASADAGTPAAPSAGGARASADPDGRARLDARDGGRLLVPPPSALPSTQGGSSWGAYRARRFRADAIFAALDLHKGGRSWPEGPGLATDAVPPPAWAAGESGYVLHLLFVRFLEAQGEGRGGALGRLVARAAEGVDAELDLSHRFRTLDELERAFHAFVLGQGVDALIAEADEEEERDPGAALKRLYELSEATARRQK